METIFDTLNAKGGALGDRYVFREEGAARLVMISGTLTDASRRTLSGQTAEAFWNSLKHVKPLSFGLNCALGAKELRPYGGNLQSLRCVYFGAPECGPLNAFMAMMKRRICWRRKLRIGRKRAG